MISKREKMLEMVNTERNMKFEYQEYNRKATDDELIDDVKRVA